MKYNLPAGDATLKMEYDSGLKISHFEASHVNSSTSFLLKSDYSYMSDGRLAAKDDLLDNTWDRTNKYDFAGRISFNQFGYSGSVRPYEQTVAYNAFSDYTGRGAYYWGSSVGNGSTVVNGRITSSPAPTYDAAGNITYQYSGPRQEQTTTYDASGRATSVKDKWPLLGANAWQEDETVHVFDGDGKPVISKARMRTSANQTWPSLTTVSYQVWSSVLGTALTTVGPDGSHVETKVMAGGAHIATNDVWKTADPVTGTTAFYAGDGTYAQKETESEPLGGQSIELIQPPGYNSNYGEVLGVSKDPEWQCLAADARNTHFKDIPTHCKKKVLESLTYQEGGPLAEIKYSMKYVIKLSPWRDFRGTIAGYSSKASDNVLAETTTSSNKPSKGGPSAFDDPDIPTIPDTDGGTVYGSDDPLDKISAENGFDGGQQNGLGIIAHLTSETDRVKKIQGIIAFAQKEKKCADAFRAVNAVPIGEQLANITIMTEGVFSTPALDHLWAPDDGGRLAKGIRAELKSRTSIFQGVTTNDITPTEEYNGRRYIALTNRAFAETDVPLAVSVIHSFIHSGGIPGKSDQTWTEYFWGVNPQDLRYLGEKYANVLENCIKK